MYDARPANHSHERKSFVHGSAGELAEADLFYKTGPLAAAPSDL
jgi:hypothetical protein